MESWQGKTRGEARQWSCTRHNLRQSCLTSCLQNEKSGATIILTAWAASKAESDLDSCSVGREVKPKIRVVTITEIAWFTVISVMVVITPAWIIMLVSVKPLVAGTIFVVASVHRAIVAIPCFRWRHPNDQRHCQESGYYNFIDVFHFDSPFKLINRMEGEKGYRFITKFTQLRQHGGVKRQNGGQWLHSVLEEMNSLTLR